MMGARIELAAGRCVRPAWPLVGLLLALTLPAIGAEALEPPATAASASTQPATAAVPTRLPEPANLRYDVTAQIKGLTYHAGADLLWQHDQDSYRLRFEFKLLSVLVRSQTSTGAVGVPGLQPLQFVDRVRSEERSARFDRQRQQVTFSDRDKPDVALEAGAQDRLSIIFQLAALVAGEPARYPPGSRLAIQTIGHNDAQTWHFIVAPEQTLRYQGEPLPAVKLTRELRDPKDQTVDVWFAPRLGYLPVRLKITQQDGDYIEQQLNAVDQP